VNKRRGIIQWWRKRGRLLALSVAPFLFVALAGGHGDLHLQILEVTKEIDKQPARGELYFKRGELNRLHGLLDAAQADYDRAFSLDTNLTYVDLARGKLFLETNWLLSAKVALDRFLTHYTNNVEGLITRARVLVRLENRLAAADDYTQALAGSTEPRPDLYIERAQALTAQGEAYLERAVQGLDEGIKKMGPLVTLQLYAIDVELKRKNFDGALARLERVAAQSPRKETWLARRGEILQQAARPADAVEAFKAALKAMDALPPTRRNVPAMAELEKRVRAALETASAAAGTSAKTLVK
jgi:predicted Zn-dependent protease